MLTYTAEMRRAMDGISFTDEDFIEKIIETGKHFRPFSEAMDAFILARGYGGKTDDTGAKTDFIRETFRAAGMKPPREISKWYEGQPISRETGFRICFAFGLDREETDDFFRRIFARERGFDCHDRDEAVYYYCLSHGLPYAYALEIRDRIRKAPEDVPESSEVVFTGSIIEDLNHIGSVEELAEYLTDHADLFAAGNITAYAAIRKMWDMAAGRDGLLRKERERLPSIQDDPATGETAAFPAGPGMPVSEAYMALFQLDRGQVTRLNNPKNPVRPILESMHAHVQDCFPNEQGMDRILRGDHSVSYETVRKWLILLSFYVFWAGKAVARGSYEALPEDRKRCMASMDSHLVEAGYPELYEGNPYDWIYCYAAGDEYPLETFRWIWTFLMDRALGV